jgi:hypothetical protein
MLLAVSAIFYGLCFVHLKADFPNGSPWNDWSKMTDEGWYGGAAIQHFVQGSWYLPSSFNPAVAMPVWPVMLATWFACTGVGMVAARTLTVLLYGVSLALLYSLVRQRRPWKDGGIWLPAIAVTLMTANPFCYAFDRLAILEPVMVFWLMLGLWFAGRTRQQDLGRQIGIGVLLSLLVLTKSTGLFLAPAVLYHLAATMGLTRREWIRPVLVAVATAIVIWLAYYLLMVRPHYLEDYRLLFSANQDRVHLSIIPQMAFKTLRAALWINWALFPAALMMLLLSLFWLRELWRMPLFGSAVIATTGYLAFIFYHGNMQPRYFLVVSMPVVIVLVLGLESLWERNRNLGLVLGAAVALVTFGMMIQTVRYAMHPEYTLATAAESIAAQIRGDASAKQLLIASTAANVTLLTGIPSLCPDYTTHGLDRVFERYQPGWYAAYEVWDDDRVNVLKKRYRLVEKARYKVFDDPTRQILVLYRMGQ